MTTLEGMLNAKTDPFLAPQQPWERRIEMQKLIVVVGGQFGSEGKGAIAGYLAARYNPVSVRVGGPNAGHTVYDTRGRAWKLQQVPVGAVTCDAPLAVGAGSEVDVNILEAEMAGLEWAGFRVAERLLVDESATILEEGHSARETLGAPHGEEGLTRRIGSTGKGVGAARADRIWRTASTVDSLAGPTFRRGDTSAMLREALRAGEHVLVEGTQGYGLGLHTPFYPYVTSGDCRAIDFLAQAGLSPWQVGTDQLDVWVVLRTYPIRVAGNSGPLHRETTWGALGQAPEYTTVTKKERRVGEWDAGLAHAALLANGGLTGHSQSSRVKVALTFLDYDFPILRECDDVARIYAVAGGYLHQKEQELGHRISLVGTGPNTIANLEGYF